jgi:hypothetical protein
VVYESIQWEQVCSDTPSDTELNCADFHDIGVKETVNDEKKESGFYHVVPAKAERKSKSSLHCSAFVPVAVPCRYILL